MPPKGKKPIKILEAHLGHYKAAGLDRTDKRTIDNDKRLKGQERIETIIKEMSINFFLEQCHKENSYNNRDKLKDKIFKLITET